MHSKRKNKYKTFLKYLIIYIAVIFVFAIIYSLLPNSFYHSTVRYEAGFISYENKIKDELQNNICDNIVRKANNESIFIDTEKRYFVNIKDIKVANITYNDFFGFDVVMYITDTKDVSKLMATGDNTSAFLKYLVIFNVSLDSNRLFMEDGDVIVGGKIKQSSDVYNPITQKDEKIVFNIQNIFYNSSMDSIYIKIAKDLDDKILNILRGNNGLPSSVNGNFWRMLYLSMVTITTLGFGDIVPITTISRMLIGFESVLGIVIIGLFVNTLFEVNKKDAL